MEGAWLMLQQDEPDDYVLASGVGHTVAELAEVAFAHVGLDAGGPRQGRFAARPPAGDHPPVGDASRARDRLGWRPTLGFEQLIHRMVDADLRALQAR